MGLQVAHKPTQTAESSAKSKRGGLSCKRSRRCFRQFTANVQGSSGCARRNPRDWPADPRRFCVNMHAFLCDSSVRPVRRYLEVGSQVAAESRARNPSSTRAECGWKRFPIRLCGCAPPPSRRRSFRRRLVTSRLSLVVRNYFGISVTRSTRSSFASCPMRSSRRYSRDTRNFCPKSGKLNDCVRGTNP